MSSGAQSALSPLAPTLRGRTVLVVEDHRDSRELLTSVLRALQAHVVTAANVEAAELQVQMSRPNLIVCDMNLPDGTGLDFIKWLRALPRGGNTPAVAVTGWENRFPATAASGFDAYMRKPIDVEKFCTVAVALGQR